MKSSLGAQKYSWGPQGSPKRSPRVQNEAWGRLWGGFGKGLGDFGKALGGFGKAWSSTWVLLGSAWALLGVTWTLLGSIWGAVGVHVGVLGLFSGFTSGPPKVSPYIQINATSRSTEERGTHINIYIYNYLYI